MAKNYNQNNRNNRRQQPRKKVTPVTATALFLNFKDAISSLRDAHPAIEEFFAGIDVNDSYDDYVAYVAEKALENYPQLLGKKNIHTQFSISGTNIFVRTEDQLAFGWTATYKVEDGRASITCIKNTIVMYDTFQELKDSLAAASWDLEERQPKRNTPSSKTE